MSCNTNVGGANSAHLASKKVLEIPLGQIRLTDKYRFRVRDDENTIEKYTVLCRQYLVDKAEDKESAEYPYDDPIVVLYENGVYHVIAGWHRFQAAQRAGMKEIRCIVLTDPAEAVQIGIGSNRHGLPLNDDDKTHCIKMAVPALALSNRMIAKLVGCSSRHVDKVVEKYQLRTGSQLVMGKDGKMHPASKKCNESGTPPLEPPALEIPPPEVPQQEILPPETLKVILPDNPPKVNSNVLPIDRIIGELKTAWELHQTTEPEQWAAGILNSLKELLDASPTGEHRRILLWLLHNEPSHW